MPPTGWPSLSTTIVGTLPASVALLESSLPLLLRMISSTTATTIASPPAVRVCRLIYAVLLALGRAAPCGRACAAAGSRQRRSISGSEQRRRRPAGEAEGDQEASPGSPRGRACRP